GLRSSFSLPEQERVLRREERARDSAGAESGLRKPWFQAASRACPRRRGSSSFSPHRVSERVRVFRRVSQPVESAELEFAGSPRGLCGRLLRLRPRRSRLWCPPTRRRNASAHPQLPI